MTVLSAVAIPALIQMLKTAILHGHDRLAEGVGESCRYQCKAFVATTKRNLATLGKFETAAISAGLQLEDVTSIAHMNNVHFHHHAALQPQRTNIVLHELSIPDS